MELELFVLSLRYSSWSIRPWLALTHAGADLKTTTATLDNASPSGSVDVDLPSRRKKGSVTGLFPVLSVDGERIHEALAICELTAELFPEAGLWPVDRMARARARAVSTEMATGFPALRQFLSCHPFGRRPGYEPPTAALREIDRVFEVWTDALQRSGGPFLFGEFTIADCMYFPVVTRFETYDVTLPDALIAYTEAMWQVPAVKAWRAVALRSPRIESYDAALTALGGDPRAIET